MMEEEITHKSDTLSALINEDLSQLGLEELEERITTLKAEIERITAVLESKKGSRLDAEALFKTQRIKGNPLFAQEAVEFLVKAAYTSTTVNNLS